MLALFEMLQLAKALISSKNQIVVPIAVKDMLDANSGDYILFNEENGKIYITVGKIVEK
jgi:bifunctional DNA-binding transcriptional regulator/antitoxin component of YhaV-PrlF toxin-antitoxin module